MAASKTIFAAVIAALSASAVAVLASSQDSRAAGEPERHGQRCSNRTLHGAYGIKFDGRKVTGELFVSVSHVTFDGVGTFTTREIGRFNGVLVERTFTGPYTVNADCTGFLDFSSSLTDPAHPAHGNFVIVSEGREFFVVDNEEGWAATGIGKRI